MTRYGTWLIAIALLLAATACGAPARAHRVPAVVGERLDVAEDTLGADGLRYEAVGGGVFGIVVRSNWVVCRQTPGAGTVAKSVTLDVCRAYDD